MCVNLLTFIQCNKITQDLAWENQWDCSLQVWLPHDADEDELCQQAWIRVQWLYYIIEGLTCWTCMFIWLRSHNDKNLKLQCSVLTDECAWSFILISHKFPGEVKRINWKPIPMSLPSNLNGSSSRIQSLLTMDLCCIGKEMIEPSYILPMFYCPLYECFVQAFDQESISVRPTQSRWPSWTRLSRSLDNDWNTFWFTDMIEILLKVVKSWNHWSYGEHV
jgi:hypothetical protein